MTREGSLEEGGFLRQGLPWEHGPWAWADGSEPSSTQPLPVAGTNDFASQGLHFSICDMGLVTVLAWGAKN